MSADGDLVSRLGPVEQHTRLGAAITVLVADDNDRYRAGIIRAIEKQPEIAVALEATDGRGALEAIRMGRPDAVLIDARMPIIDGLTVVRTVVNDPDLHDVPLVVMSADGTLETLALSAGATSFVDKTASRQEICAALIAAAGRAPKTP